MTSSLLEIKDLRKSYGDELVLQDVSLSLSEHQVKVVIGASGSGKSTLLRCVNLLEAVDDGQILLAGEDITSVGVNADQVRAQIGSVFQAFNLFPHLTVIQNIILAPVLVHGVSKEEAKVQALKLLERFDLIDKAGQYPDLLSGGQQQRVAILRAVINKPKVLLLDEVTSALDPILIAEVLALISELKADGMTMMIATHEMGFAKQVADEVLFLHQGQICEVGRPEDVLVSPQTHHLADFLGSLRRAGRL
ncbi:MAG: amino acid ABC transporter ATP-binding protein [Actinobacteria bacterium]|nr:amino acid ABC transporter ATP-binding protein [Actinomycetota bacterium]